MLNYHDMAFQADEHRNMLLATASQQCLAQSLAAGQRHPLLAWAG